MTATVLLHVYGSPASAIVRLTDPSSGRRYQGITDQGGKGSIGLVEPGIYQMTLQRRGEGLSKSTRIALGPGRVTLSIPGSYRASK